MKTRSWHHLGVPAVASFVLAAAGLTSSAAAQAGSNTCAGAPLITPGTYNGSTAGASSDGSASCGAAANSPDMWYRITPAEDASLELATCGSPYDTVLSVHTGCPGTEANQIACNDDSCSWQSRIIVGVEAGQTYYIRVSGYSGASGSYTLTVGYQEPPPPGSGPDVTYQNINGITAYGPVGPIMAYSLGTDTCNIGTQNLLWTNGGTPGVGFNVHRLHDGRFMQLGMSWVKIACCAAAGPGCGLACNGAGGSVLGAGCLDVYGASYNASHTGLRPRSAINPWTGTFNNPGFGGTGTIDRRLQVQTSDLSPVTFPGALFFAEGVYVASDEGPDAKLNNASHRRVTFSGNAMSLATNSPMRSTVPAIYAWREHGGGINTPDNSVVIEEVDVPDEGRFIVAHKVRDLGNGTWRYDYAVFNLNSHRSGASFSIPLGPNVNVSNAGFNSPRYHTGEPYDNTPWTMNVSGNAVTWSSPQTFDQNQNTNALRWGTTYSFWFDADSAPEMADATLGLFRPGTPSSLTISVGAPAGGVGGCLADWDGDGAVSSLDISAFIVDWVDSVTNGTLVADYDNNGVVNSSDISSFITQWLFEIVSGC